MRGKSLCDESMLAISFTTLVCAFLFVQAAEGTVRCYVCSWQKPTNYGANITDTCSHYNFNEAAASQVECEKGCEAVSIRQSKNEDVSRFYKNCISSSNKNPVDKCTTNDDGMMHTTTCECTSNLCNGAERIGGQYSGVYFLFTLIGICSTMGT